MASPTDPSDAAVTLRAAEATAHRLAGELFSWDLTRALELALLKTFCLPSISGLLARTGEFERRPRKRYDDTGLMVAELLRHGLDSPAGAAVITRMNRIHGHYAISNDDFLYVLSTFVAEPTRWLNRYGWRPLTPEEQEHLFRFWCGVGDRMGIADLPDSLEALLALNERVERDAFAPPCGEVCWACWIARPAPPWVGAPRLTGCRRWCCRPCEAAAARFYSQHPTPSYGATFRLEQLGPPPLLADLAKQEVPPLSRQPMVAPFQSPHFAIARTEDGWIIEARVTKDQQGDWLLSRHELEELQALLERVIAS